MRKILLFILVLLTIGWAGNTLAVCVIPGNDYCDVFPGEDCNNCPSECPCSFAAGEQCQPVGPAGAWGCRMDSVCGNDNCEYNSDDYWPAENCDVAHPDGCPGDCVCAGGVGNCDLTDPLSNEMGCILPDITMATSVNSPLSATTFGALIGDITNFIFYFAVVLAPILFIIAGFYFTTAGGDAGRINTAKNIATLTIIGLAIIFLAKGIIEVIKSVLGII